MRLWHKSIRKQLKLIAGETRVETGQPSEHNPADPLHMQYPLCYQHAAQKQALWKQKNKLLAYWHVTERGKKIHNTSKEVYLEYWCVTHKV